MITTNPTDLDERFYLAMGERMGADLLRQRLTLQVEHAAEWYGGLGMSRFHPENIELLPVVVEFVLRRLNLFERGRANALEYRVVRREVPLRKLPSAFDGFTILHLSDIHADGIPDQGERLTGILAGLPADVCVMTGDFRFATWGDYQPAMAAMAPIAAAVRATHGTVGILGNHDSLEMVPDLERMGIRLLLNESTQVNHRGAKLSIVGLDDAHFYGCHDLDRAGRGLDRNLCRILLSHSPEIYALATHCGYDLMLSGHTHGGQICLPGRVPVITNADCPRHFKAGFWHHQGLSGFTSRGTGSSGVAVRFCCPPEIAILTLRSAC